MTTSPPSTADCDELWMAAASIEVLDGGVHNDRPLGEKVLLTIEDAQELSEFASSLAIVENRSQWMCMCLGSLAIVVRATDGRTLAALGFHHASHIRWEAMWSSDAELANGHGVAEFLAERGVRGPAEELEELKRRRAQSKRDLEHWLEAAPEGTKQVAERIAEACRAAPATADMIDDLQARLDREYPSQVEKVQALLRWFGSGTGRCSGYPMWEAVPGRLLFEYTTQEVITGISPLDSATVAGALRLFVGHDFRKRRAELGSLPDPVLQALKEEAEHSTDEDKKKRALRVFGERT